MLVRLRAFPNRLSNRFPVFRQLGTSAQKSSIGIVARRSVAEKDRDMVHRVIKLTAESIKYIQTNRDGTKKIMAKWMPMKEADIAEGLYRFATENYAKEGFTPEGALRAMTKQMIASNLVDAKAAAVTPVTAYYDNRYVDEVKRSGFFEQLWR